jgi:hypothetical protein
LASHERRTMSEFLDFIIFTVIVFAAGAWVGLRHG